MRQLLFLLLATSLFSFIGDKQNDGVQLGLSKELHEPITTDSLLLWSETPLRWSDFQGEPNKRSSFKAMTFSRIAFSTQLYEDSIVLFVPTYFIRYKSWSTLKDSDELLAHEQLHFDIAEVVARKIRKECASLRPTTNIENTFERLQDIYNRNYNAYWNSFDKYDEDTHHGTIEKEQKRWEQKVADLLTKSTSYSAVRVVIRR